MEINRATAADLDGILALQTANQPENGGSLSAKLPRSRITAMMADMPLIVTLNSAKVVGFLMTSSRAMNADIPIINAMLTAYPGTDDSYIYGPICIAEQKRGKGLAQAMFTELRRLEPDREGILFIRRDNPASLRAHKKMGMHEVACFEFNGVDHSVFSYFG